MIIPIRDKFGNVIRVETIDNPYVSPPVDFNKTKEKNLGKNPSATGVTPENLLTSDLNLGVIRVVESNKAYWKGRPPNEAQNK